MVWWFVLAHVVITVVSMALHPDGKTVATGQMGARPVIHIWDATAAEGKQLITTLKARTLQRACLYLAWSSDGSKLAAVGQDDDHTLHVFSDWSKGDGASVVSKELDKNKILDIAFNLTTVLAVGVNHVSFWDTTSRVLKGKKGLFQSNPKATVQPVVSAAWFGDKAVTGTASGHLYVWSGVEIEAIVKAHLSVVNALYVSAGFLLSGGKDGKINQWDGTFNRTRNVDTAGRAVRSLWADLDATGSYLVGLGNADIITISSSDKETLLHEGHFEGELWALATHPSNSTYATAGDDKMVSARACGACLRCGRVSLRAVLLMLLRLSVGFVVRCACGTDQRTAASPRRSWTRGRVRLRTPLTAPASPWALVVVWVASSPRSTASSTFWTLRR